MHPLRSLILAAAGNDAIRRLVATAPGSVRCANALQAGNGHPMFATHDPRPVRIVGGRARRGELDEQRHLAREGETVRLYVPYGSQRYGYLMRRPAGTTARTLVRHS